MPKLTSLAIILSATTAAMLGTSLHAGSSLSALSDDELASVEGQALMSLSYLAPKDTGNPMKNITGNNVGFYKLGLEALLEINANIRTLQLGCGGVNGVDGCDVDIRNLALSGLPSDYESNPSKHKDGPVFSNEGGRAATSAQITNPFAEFAISNPDQAATREMVGIRFSAEKIRGLLTTGLTNSAEPSTTDGIQSLSGFMRVASTKGVAKTQSALFGKSPEEIVRGKLHALQDRDFTSDPTSSDTHGITIPSIDATFNVPAFQLNGQRMDRAIVRDIAVSTPDIDLTTGVNQLLVRFDPILLIASKAKFQMDTGSKVTGLKLNATFEQSLSMIHNVPLTGQGGYLSLQSKAIKWPGTHLDPGDGSKTTLASMFNSDVAQRGWWLGFNEEVQLGDLSGGVPVNISSVLPQVADRITAFLNTEAQRIEVPVGDALGSIIGTPVKKTLVINLSDATPAAILLQNMQIKNQTVVANCYGGLKFC